MRKDSRFSWHIFFPCTLNTENKIHARDQLSNRFPNILITVRNRKDGDPRLKKQNHAKEKQIPCEYNIPKYLKQDTLIIRLTVYFTLTIQTYVNSRQNILFSMPSHAHHAKLNGKTSKDKLMQTMKRKKTNSRGMQRDIDKSQIYMKFALIYLVFCIVYHLFWTF